MNLANKLTLGRILLIPAFVGVLMTDLENKFILALIIFCVASLTDFFDGYVARKYNYSNYSKTQFSSADRNTGRFSIGIISPLLVF